MNTAVSSKPKQIADIVLAVVVLAVVAMMILPLPTAVLDVLISANVAVGVLLLLVSMYVSSALELSAFPTILLVTTLYRLALNVSSTRLILLQADAGEVIRAFGDFVVQGNYVVGAVVFLILTLIQFLVIAKGSERVAEVGARFTLDAMPGKQMSIDAEVRAGAITQEEARQQRAQLGRESQFYGAMDGAMKFVKGDAIAGIVITIVNILGGLAIGVAMRDMSAGEALQRYGLLTIGDGLVSQIPALLISTSAGLVVTRVASAEESASLGGDVASQVFGDGKALRIASVFLLALAIVPGLPAFPFLVLSGLFFVQAHRLSSAKPKEAVAEVVVQEEAKRETEARKQRIPLVVPVAVEVSQRLAEAVADESGQGPMLETEIPVLRERLFIDLGLPLPGVRCRAVSLAEAATHEAAGTYRIALQEVPRAEGIAYAEHVFVVEGQRAIAMGYQGQTAICPIEKTQGLWIDEDHRAALEEAGLAPMSTAAFIADHLGLIVERHAARFVGIQATQAMLDQLERAYPALVRNVVPKPVSVALLADILRRLVEESVSIRPLREILETLAIHAAESRDPVALTELVRAGLKDQITNAYAHGGAVAVTLLSPEIEDAIRDAIQRGPSGSYLALAPDLAREIIAAITRHCPREHRALLLTKADIRRFVRKLIEVELPDLIVLSFNELSPAVQVDPQGRVQI